MWTTVGESHDKRVCLKPFAGVETAEPSKCLSDDLVPRQNSAQGSWNRSSRSTRGEGFVFKDYPYDENDVPGTEHRV